MTARIAGIWRYPVKSMLGQSMAEVEIGTGGLNGDRRFALVDVEDGKVASAKNPRKWGQLLSCRAAFVDDTLDVAQITLPDGSQVDTDDQDIDAVLSKALGRSVELARVAP